MASPFSVPGFLYCTNSRRVRELWIYNRVSIYQTNIDDCTHHSINTICHSNIQRVIFREHIWYIPAARSTKLVTRCNKSVYLSLRLSKVTMSEFTFASHLQDSMYKLSLIRLWEKHVFPCLTHHHKPYPLVRSDQPLWGQGALVPLYVAAPQTTRRGTLCGESNFSLSFLVSLGTKPSAGYLFDFFEFCRRVLELCLLEAWETNRTLIVQASWSGPIWNRHKAAARREPVLFYLVLEAQSFR